MPNVACPSCAKGVALPDPPAAATYTCPHCGNPVPAPGRAPARKPAKQPAASAFDFDSDEQDDATEPAPRSRVVSRRPHGSGSEGASWLTIFSATLAANVLAGIVILIGVRFYVIWSIADALKK